MAEDKPSKTNFWLSFLGAVGAILIFLLILLVAYLPDLPDPVDAEVKAERARKADEAIAESEQKLRGYAVVNAESGTVRIPIERAMERTVRAYRAGDAASEAGEGAE